MRIRNTDYDPQLQAYSWVQTGTSTDSGRKNTVNGTKIIYNLSAVRSLNLSRIKMDDKLSTFCRTAPLHTTSLSFTQTLAP